MPKAEYDQDSLLCIRSDGLGFFIFSCINLLSPWFPKKNIGTFFYSIFLFSDPLTQALSLRGVYSKDAITHVASIFVPSRLIVVQFFFLLFMHSLISTFNLLRSNKKKSYKNNSIFFCFTRSFEMFCTMYENKISKIYRVRVSETP